MVVKIGCVVRGQHDRNQRRRHVFHIALYPIDYESSKWTFCDLEFSNGTVLSGVILIPNVPLVIKDGDCIRIRELRRSFGRSKSKVIVGCREILGGKGSCNCCCCFGVTLNVNFSFSLHIVPAKSSSFIAMSCYSGKYGCWSNSGSE